MIAVGIARQVKDRLATFGRTFVVCGLLAVTISGCTTTSDSAILVLDPATATTSRATATERATEASAATVAATATGGIAAIATVRPTDVARASPVAAGTAVAAANPARSSSVSDGICQMRVPTDWSDDGGGRGRTPGGHAFSLGGFRLATPEAWTQAAALFKQSLGGRAGATVTEGADFVHVVFADDRGFAHRAGFGDRYCDLRVTARNGPIAADEQAAWDTIVASLAPANGER